MTAPIVRKPLVFASRRALDDARDLLGPSVVLENVAGARIAEGHVSHRPAVGGEAIVDLGDGVVAVATRSTSILSGRKCWRVAAVRRSHSPAGVR